MGQATQTYKRSFSASVGAGLSSVFGGGGRTYYILEHKVSSKYHKAGEAQEIIVDQIELGRDSRCQVQFDESFKTVSRRHAAIVRDGENWKLIQLSQTNTTFLNGRPVQNEWYLQNGDEIQLSVNGPKLGFIVPSGNKSKTGSIGLSRRLSLFRQQALKPYKTAMWAMASALVVVICLGVGYGIYANNKAEDIIAELTDSQKRIEILTEINNGLREDMRKQDSINKANASKIDYYRKQAVPVDVSALIAKAKSDVFYIETHLYLELNDEIQDLEYAVTGTGFLLNNGCFVTARHCVEPWLYKSAFLKLNAACESSSAVKMHGVIYAYDENGLRFTLRSDDFRMDRGRDVITSVELEDGSRLHVRIPFGENGERDMDWAYAKKDYKGNALPSGKLLYDAAMSTNMKAGSEVHLLGYPGGLGAGDGNNGKLVEPIYNRMTISRDGLNKRGVITISQGADHGNSGGPLFALKDRKLYVIGILSGGTSQTEYYDELVPICNILK